MKTKDLEWFPLDPAKADLRATHGAYINGVTLLELPSGSVVVVGFMSCGSRASAESHVRRYTADALSRELDRRVSRATLLSWAASD